MSPTAFRYRLTRCGRGAALLTALLLVSPQVASACSCAAASFAKRYELSANVFTAVITGEQTERSGDRSTLVRNPFAVTRAFKGDQPFAALVSERSDVVSCGNALEVGAEYLFFTENSGRVGVCPGPQPKASAGPELAALSSFVTGRRATIAEPWHFSASADACGVVTHFTVADELELGTLSFDGWRPGRESPAFGRAKVDIFPSVDLRSDAVSVSVDGASYEAKIRAPGVYTLAGDAADDLLRKALTADALRLRLGSVEIDVSTANLADAGTDAKLRECIGPP